MKMQKVAEMVVARLESMVGADEKVIYQEITKNNGVVLHGITILKKGETISPTIYLENFFPCLEDFTEEEIREVVMGKVVWEIIDLSNKHRNPELPIEVKNLMDFNYAKDKLSVRLINFEKNKKRLEEIPHKRFLDLAIVCNITFANGVENGSITINNVILSNWNIAEEELFKIAFDNTPKLFKFGSKNLMECAYECSIGIETELHGFECINADDDFLYTLTNTRFWYGANVILYTNVLDEVAERLECRELIILPSSVHEVIVTKRDCFIDLEFFKGMVRDVNATQVAEEEVLSDNVYIYNSTTKRIDIVA